MKALHRELLRYSKAPDSKWEWVAVRDDFLGAMYGYEMTVVDVFVAMYYAYVAIAADSRYEISPARLHEKLILAPTTCYTHGSPAGRDAYAAEIRQWTLEEVYNSMIAEMLNDLRLTRCDWCREELFPEEYVPTAAPVAI